MHGSLIYFYKCIPEFKELDVEDQVLLIKCNLLDIVHLHRIIIQNFQDDSMIGKHMSKWFDEDFHHQMSRTRRYFNRFMNYPLILKLTLIVFIFCINLSTRRGSSQFEEYKNKRKLLEYQNYYTASLWRYLNHLFDEKEAIQAMEIIVMQILRYQSLMVRMEDHVRKGSHQLILHSLMQSIFGLS
jgi:hypothetical protein